MRLPLVALCFLLPQIVFGSVETPIAKIYAPLGYTEKETAQVVITGALPFQCYHLGETNVQIERSGFLKITQYMIHGSEHFCANPVLEYQKVVPLGNLIRGDYRVHAANQPTATTLTVTKNDGQSDDVEYAPVFHASISNKTLHMSGFAPPCMKINRVNISYQTDRDVISIEPITKKCSNLETQIEVPFSVDEPLNTNMHGDVLLHVRTGVNRFLDVVQDSDLTLFE